MLTWTLEAGSFSKSGNHENKVFLSSVLMRFGPLASVYARLIFVPTLADWLLQLPRSFTYIPSNSTDSGLSSGKSYRASFNLVISRRANLLKFEMSVSSIALKNVYTV